MKNRGIDKNIYMTIFITWIILFAFSIVSINFFFFHFERSYSSVRIDLLNEYASIITRGDVPPFLSAPEHSWGFVFYIPYMSSIMSIPSEDMIYYLHAFMSLIAFITVPCVMFKLYKKKIIAILSQILTYIFCGNILVGYKSDQMWAANWATIMSFPLIMLYLSCKESNTKRMIILFVSLICSISNVFRNQNGFAILIAMIIIFSYELVGIMKLRDLNQIWGIFFNFIVFIVGYNLISSIIPLLAGAILKLEYLDNGSFLFHSILCGWGNYPNKYGYQFSDNIIYDCIVAKYGYVKIYSSEYLECCKKEVLYILFNDIGFAINSWWKSFLDSLKTLLMYNFTYTRKDHFYFYQGKTIHNILIPVLLELSVLFYFWHKRIVVHSRVSIIVTLLALFGSIVSLVQGVLFLPSIRYVLPAFGCFNYIFVVIGIDLFNSILSFGHVGDKHE